jgi:hypothetical protein
VRSGQIWLRHEPRQQDRQRFADKFARPEISSIRGLLKLDFDS